MATWKSAAIGIVLLVITLGISQVPYGQSTDSDNTYEYSNFEGKPGKMIDKIPSSWNAQLGIRYVF
jgi:hypothetical protein